MLPASGIPSLLHYISRTHVCSAPKKRDYYCTLSGFCQTSIRKETGRNLTTRNLTSKPERSRNQNANSGAMDPEGSQSKPFKKRAGPEGSARPCSEQLLHRSFTTFFYIVRDDL